MRVTRRRSFCWLLLAVGLAACQTQPATVPTATDQSGLPLHDPSQETGSWIREAEAPPTPSDYVVRLEQMQTFYDVPGEFGHALEGSVHGFESMSFILTETHPGGGPPLHTHETEEAHVLLEGSVSYVIGDKVMTVKGPYIARVPAGVPHTFLNAGDKVLRLIGVLQGPTITYEEIGKNPLLEK